MKKLLALAVLALTAAAFAVPSAPATTTSPAKTWLCHKTSAMFTTNAGTFVKFVPIRVAGRALVRAHLAHGDVQVLPVPTGTLKARITAAKAFCGALRVAAPITPVTGGVRLEATLTGGGITAHLTARTQVGQKRLCFELDVTAPAGATVQLTSLALTRGSTTVTIGASQLTSLSSSGCVALATKSVAKVLLDGDVAVALNGTVTPSGGSAASFQATGTFSQ
jgi:hypothetical protein